MVKNRGYKCKLNIVYICNVRELNKINKEYGSVKEKSISGRYIALSNLNGLIEKYSNSDNVYCNEIGKSFLNKPIYRLKIGKGKIKVLIWTQMHGNESTGTKAVFDLLNFLTLNHSFNDIKERLLAKLSIYIMPMLNPDGAEVYTRLNAQKIDLNRDAVLQKAPESKLLLGQLESIKPKWCFNLHDQRTIFSVGSENNPATLSFLAPSTNISRTVTKGRKETMKLIAQMFNSLQTILPNQIGRYTDEFYPTATGDNFQKMGYNTVLIEAGHYKVDYERESTRKYNFLALLSGLFACIEVDLSLDYKKYYTIPNNKKNYADYLFLNLSVKGIKKTVLVLFKEELKENKIFFNPQITIESYSRKYNASMTGVDKVDFQSIELLERYVKKQIKTFEV